MEVGKIEQLTDGKKTTQYSTADLPHAPRVYQFARQEQTIKRLTEENKALLEWAQAAYTRLQSLMTIGVSMTPDAVTKRLLEDAPESVKGGEK